MQRTAYVFVMLIIFIFISCDSELKWVGELDSKKDEKAVNGICGTKECGHTEYEFRGKTHTILCGECTDGFECVSNDCKDIDECATDNGDCEQGCKNTDGGRTCECENGYKLATDGKGCDDIDECKTNNGGCDQVCVNNDGGRDCDCNQGYILGDDNTTCDDMDECSDIELNTCSEFADCFNTVGDFNCKCRENYSGDGKNCVADTRTQSCTGLEDNAEWNTASSITQTWNGTEWAPSTAGVYNATPSTTECQFICKTNYSWDDSNCVADTKTFTCSAKPAGSDWNTVESYVQTWNGTQWLPADSATEYGEAPVSDSCRYKCAMNYTWDGLICVADIKTDQACTGFPSNTTLNTASSITQTWNGTAWIPSTIASYNETPSTTECRFKCANDFHWENSACISNSRSNQSCTGKPVNAFWNTASSITQTWNGTAWMPSTASLFNTTSSTTECRFKCDINYTWNSGTSTCVAETKTAQSCTGLPTNAVWNTASSISQTWSGTAWLPTTAGAYNAFASTTECRFKCSPYYEWSGSSCVQYGAMCTGQTLCYNGTTTMTCPVTGASYYGQDSQYKTLGACFLRDYTISGTAGSDIVTDNNTGLVWQRTFPATYAGCTGGAPAGSTCTWQQAIDYCDVLTYAGQTDWRLPTFAELETLLDYGKYSPSIDTDVFPSTQSDSYWSYTEYAGITTQAWNISFSAGTSSHNPKTSATGIYVRCVRGNEWNPVGTFEESTVSGKVIVTDTETGFIWQKEYSDTLTWINALSYCETSTYAGYKDWRLPNVNELKTLFNLNSINPASSFPGMPSSYFWSSSTRVSGASSAWLVNSAIGDMNLISKTDSLYVRCVR